jgi:hypothetical protein
MRLGAKMGYTDYPLYETGKVLIREIEVIGYDGDKYCTVRHNGNIFQIKSGYVYPKKRRYNSVRILKNY